MADPLGRTGRPLEVCDTPRSVQQRATPDVDLPLNPWCQLIKWAVGARTSPRRIYSARDATNPFMNGMEPATACLKLRRSRIARVCSHRTVVCAHDVRRRCHSTVLFFSRGTDLPGYWSTTSIKAPGMHRTVSRHLRWRALYPQFPRRSVADELMKLYVPSASNDGRLSSLTL